MPYSYYDKLAHGQGDGDGMDTDSDGGPLLEEDEDGDLSEELGGKEDGVEEEEEEGV